jgi:hypothetical protein
MRTALLRHGARAAAAALTLATALGGATSAGASTHDGHGGHGLQARHGGLAPKAVEVRIGASGIQAPRTARPGLVAFHVQTDDPNGHFVQAFRPHPGVTVRKVLADLAKTVGQVPASTAAWISTVRDEAELFGGAQVTPDVSETFTTSISAGKVVLLDFTAFLRDPTHPVTRTLELRGELTSEKLGASYGSTVIAQETTAIPRFEVSGLDKAKDDILVHNTSDQIHEMGLQPVTPDTTDAQIHAFFDGTATGPPPFTGPSLGLGAISPGRTALLEIHHLPPGKYVLLCFVPDDKTGAPHVVGGMHKVVVLT